MERNDGRIETHQRNQIHEWHDQKPGVLLRGKFASAALLRVRRVFQLFSVPSHRGKSSQARVPLIVTNERKNITQPIDWWAAFERAAKDEGLSLAEWIGECCKANLPEDVTKELTARATVGRPKKPKSG